MDPISKALIKGYIKSIEFESNINDPIIFSDPFADSPPGISDAAIAAIRPKLTIRLWDQSPLIIAPSGEPSREARANVKVATVVGGIAIAGLGLILLTRK